MGMTTTQTETLRKQYKTLQTACLQSPKGRDVTAEKFNREVRSLGHELADGEAYEMTPAYYWRCAQQVAYEIYNVNFRHVAGCQ
jgi:hypothetical protein